MPYATELLTVVMLVASPAAGGQEAGIPRQDPVPEVTLQPRQPAPDRPFDGLFAQALQPADLVQPHVPRPGVPSGPGAEPPAQEPAPRGFCGIHVLPADASSDPALPRLFADPRVHHTVRVVPVPACDPQP